MFDNKILQSVDSTAGRVAENPNRTVGSLTLLVEKGKMNQNTVGDSA